MDDERETELARVKAEIADTKRLIAELEAEKRRTETELVEVLEGISRGDDDRSNISYTELDQPKTLAGLVNQDPLWRKAYFEAIQESNLPRESSLDFERDALIAWDSGDLQEAISLYTRAIELDRNNGIAFMNRGNVNMELGNFEDGISDLLEARAIDSELPTLHAELYQIMSPEIRELTRQKMIESRKLRK